MSRVYLHILYRINSSTTKTAILVECICVCNVGRLFWSGLVLGCSYQPSAFRQQARWVASCILVKFTSFGLSIDQAVDRMQERLFPGPRIPPKLDGQKRRTRAELAIDSTRDLLMYPHFSPARLRPVMSTLDWHDCLSPSSFCGTFPF